jgi:hypothetical protein
MSDKKFMLESDQFNKSDWDYIRGNLKWLKGIASTDDARPTLQGICFNPDKGWVAATDGFKVGVWKPVPGRSVDDGHNQSFPIFEKLPAGVWYIDTLNSKMIVLLEVEGNFPNISAIINVPETTNALTGQDSQVVIDLAFKPIHLAQLTAGFESALMTIQNSMHYVYLSNENRPDWKDRPENFGVIMGMMIENGYKSARLRPASPDDRVLV